MLYKIGPRGIGALYLHPARGYINALKRGRRQNGRIKGYNIFSLFVEFEIILFVTNMSKVDFERLECVKSGSENCLRKI